MNKIIAAAQFAADAHAGQVRKWTGAPYITHPARVASRAMLLQSTCEGLVCAAWLHDTIEDCGVTVNRLADLFGPAVASIVSCLTNASKGSNLPRAERKKLDREKLAAAPIEAKQIKLLDRIDNLNELPCFPATLSFCKTYAEESDALLQVIGDASEPLARELAEAIRDLRRRIEPILREARAALPEGSI